MASIPNKAKFDTLAMPCFIFPENAKLLGQNVLSLAFFVVPPAIV